MSHLAPGKDFIGVGCGAIVVNENNEVLLLKRGKGARNNHGFWSRPGGAVEFGETIEAALLREIKEETGLEIEIVRRLQTTESIKKEEHSHWVSFSFLARVIFGEAKNMETGQHDEIKWFPLSDLPDNIVKDTQVAIEEYIKSLQTSRV